MNAHIVIEVSGGVVQSVMSDSPQVSVKLIDWDNIEAGDTPHGCYPTDYLSKSKLKAKLTEIYREIKDMHAVQADL